MKSLLAGAVSALLMVVAILLATTAWFVSMSRGAGAGGVGAVWVGVFDLLSLPVVLAFVLGFVWMFRRQRRAFRPI